MLKFKRGRQRTGYMTATLFSFLLPKLLRRFVYGVDCHLIVYPTGTHIRSHVDKVDKHLNHHRVNMIVRQPSRGYFYTEVNGVRTYNRRRIIWFRPDVDTHGVDVCSGRRVVFSVGWTTVSG